MNDSGYKPVSCAIHSKLELLAIRGIRVRLVCEWEEQSGVLCGRIADLYARGGVEYLELEKEPGQSVIVRLDRIENLDELEAIN